MTRTIADISVALDGFVTTGEVGQAASVVTGSPPGPARPTDIDVVLVGGGVTTGPAIDAAPVGTLTPRLAPVVPGAGTPPCTVEAPPHTPVRRPSASTSTATHPTCAAPR